MQWLFEKFKGIKVDKSLKFILYLLSLYEHNHKLGELVLAYPKIKSANIENVHTIR